MSRRKHLAAIIAAAGSIIGLNGAYAEQTTLSAGDIAFIAANSDAPDTFAFVPLVNIKQGTFVIFTDNSRVNTSTGDAWRKGTSGGWSEGPHFVWVASADISAGSVQSFVDTAHGNMGLSSSGDQLFAFQGTVQNPDFIAAVAWTNTDPFITTGAADANKSYLPSTLTLGTNAVEVAINPDNAAYNGTTSGTAADLRTAINTASNWTTNDTTVLAGPASFTVSSPATAPTAAIRTLAYTFGPTSSSYTQNATVTPDGITAGVFERKQGTGTMDVDGSNALVGQAYQLSGGFSTNATLDQATDQAMGFDLTIQPGYYFDIASIELAYQRDANGPQNVAIYVSTDGFVTSTQIGTDLTILASDINVGTVSFTDSSPTQYMGTLAFRIYGWNAVTSAGVLEIDEVWVRAAVPEPASLSLVGLVGAGLLARRRRKA